MACIAENGEMSLGHTKLADYEKEDLVDLARELALSNDPTQGDGGTEHRKVERGGWSGQFDFLMSLIAYAVGLGNVWRFPYLVFKNGGGAFLLAYFLCWLLAAVPVFYLEVAAGQFFQRGGIGVWKACPIFKGVGVANVIISCMCCIYYCIIVSWSLYYLFASFAKSLPWVSCGHTWNDARCISLEAHHNANATNWTRLLTRLEDSDWTINDTQTPVEQFWERRVLTASAGIHETGTIQWQLALILILSWLMVYFALWKGIVHARKLVYFCAISPYILLFILLGRGVTLPGATEGLKYFLKPNMSKLASTTLWKDAGTQVFYSYGIGFGAIMALGSYNSYNHNCKRDVLVLCCINLCTSLLGGLVVFSVLGFMAQTAQKTVGQVVKSGVGLAFLVYPEVVSVLPVSQLWSVLFFVMIVILGMDSQVCMVEGVMTALGDAFPRQIRKHKELSVGIFCLVNLLLGLPMVTQAGQFWLTLVDQMGAAGFTLLFVVFFEIVGLSWGFGAERLSLALEDMLHYKPSRIWLLLWKFVSPALCVVIFALVVLKYEPVAYPDERPYPTWAQILGILMSLTSMLAIPIVGIYQIATANGSTFIEKVRSSMQPKVSLPSTVNTELSIQQMIPSENMKNTFA